MPFAAPHRVLCWLMFFAIGSGIGCVPPILPENVDTPNYHPRLPAEQIEGAQYFDELFLEDGRWLEINRPDGGKVGGYLSTAESSDRSLVLIFPGASTFQVSGAVDQAFGAHRDEGADFRAAGFRTLAIARRECGSAFGGDELQDALAVVDWLNASGKAELRVDRVYAYGYSTGGTLVTLLNRQRSTTAVAALSGLSSPQQLFDFRDLYTWIAAIFPKNTGLCQLGSTFAAYGDNGSAGWQALDTVDQIEELNSPELFVHGGEDIIFLPENFLQLERRYEELVAKNVAVVPLEFVYLPDATHFSPPDDPSVREMVIDFFRRHP